MTATRAIDLAGPGDAAAARRLRKELAALLVEGEASVELDLARVEWLGSACLAAVVAADKGLRSAGGALSLRDPRPAVLETIRRCGLDGTLSITSGAVPPPAA